MKSLIIDGDWTFVTRNSIDFRGPRDAPGSKGQYADVAVHAGLICFNGPVGMDLDLQLEMFEETLDELDRNDDLVNKSPSRIRRGTDITMTELAHLRKGNALFLPEPLGSVSSPSDARTEPNGSFKKDTT